MALKTHYSQEDKNAWTLPPTLQKGGSRTVRKQHKILKTESILKNSHKITTKEALLYIVFVSDDLRVLEPLNIGMYIYMKLTHTEHCVQVLLLFFFETHTQVTVRLSSLFKCSEKQSTAGIKGAVSNTVLSCKNGVRIPESQRHCCPLHYWIISFSKENL